MFLAIFEPPNSEHETFFDENPDNFIVCLVVEIFILLCYLAEFGMEVYHRRYDNTKKFTEKYIKNLKVLSKIVLMFLFTLDFIIFYASLPVITFRFSRPFRPCMRKIVC